MTEAIVTSETFTGYLVLNNGGKTIGNAYVFMPVEALQTAGLGVDGYDAPHVAVVKKEEIFSTEVVKILDHEIAAVCDAKALWQLLWQRRQRIAEEGLPADLRHLIKQPDFIKAWGKDADLWWFQVEKIPVDFMDLAQPEVTMGESMADKAAREQRRGPNITLITGIVIACMLVLGVRTLFGA